VLEQKSENSEESDHIFVNDTSDFDPSDNGENYHRHEGSVQNTETDPDPYQKIKLHASLALRNLFKHNSKAIYNYWYIMFPTFMMRP
jgi:hypothetical protein